jgi:hypothetical protein
VAQAATSTTSCSARSALSSSHSRHAFSTTADSSKFRAAGRSSELYDPVELGHRNRPMVLAVLQIAPWLPAPSTAGESRLRPVRGDSRSLTTNPSPFSTTSFLVFASTADIAEDNSFNRRAWFTSPPPAGRSGNRSGAISRSP